MQGFPELCPGNFSRFFRGLCFFAPSVRLIGLLSMEPRPLAPLSFPGAFAAVAPPGCLIRLLPVETSLLPSCCGIVRPRLCPSTRMRPDNAGCRRDTKKRPLLCRGRFSFAARCQLPERPHFPRGVAAFRSVRHVDEEFEPAFGFDLRHGYRTTVRCLGLVCGLLVPESDALQFVGRKRGYGLSRGALFGAQQYLVIMRRYGARVAAGCRSSYPLSRQNNIPLPHRAYRRITIRGLCFPGCPMHRC